MDYQAQPPKEGQRLGPPLSAKIAILFALGLVLTIFFSHLYKNQESGITWQAEVKNGKKVFTPVRFKSAQNDAQSLHLRAKYLITQHRYKEAEIWAEKSLQAKKNFYRAYMDLGVVYSSYGDFIRAEKVFKKALEFIGNDTFDLEIIYGDLGLIYLVERRFGEAWEYLHKSYERKAYLGNNFWADHRLKYVIENDKDRFIKQAENDDRLPLEINQRRIRLRRLLGINNDEIISDSEQYLLNNPGSVYSYVFRSLLASALYRKGETEKALELLRMVESDKNLPANYIPWIKFMYAYIYEDKGEKQKAIDYLNDIIMNHPDYESIDQVKEMLERIETNQEWRPAIEDTRGLPQASD